MSEEGTQHVHWGQSAAGHCVRRPRLLTQPQPVFPPEKLVRALAEQVWQAAVGRHADGSIHTQCEQLPKGGGAAAGDQLVP